MDSAQEKKDSLDGKSRVRKPLPKLKKLTNTQDASSHLGGNPNSGNPTLFKCYTTDGCRGFPETGKY